MFNLLWDLQFRWLKIKGIDVASLHVYISDDFNFRRLENNVIK